ncbi:metacaspase-7-like [Physcomitrium patens]
MDEMIFPFDHTNPLSDEDFRDVVSTISEGVNFTFITDSCCSGGLIDEMKAHVGGKEQIEDLESHIEAWKACTGQCARR